MLENLQERGARCTIFILVSYIILFPVILETFVVLWIWDEAAAFAAALAVPLWESGWENFAFL